MAINSSTDAECPEKCRPRNHLDWITCWVYIYHISSRYDFKNRFVIVYGDVHRYDLKQICHIRTIPFYWIFLFLRKFTMWINKYQCKYKFVSFNNYIISNLYVYIYLHFETTNNLLLLWQAICNNSIKCKLDFESIYYTEGVDFTKCVLTG